MSKSKDNSFLWGIHYFRGVAILIIIAVHVWMNPLARKNADKTDWVEFVREALFDGSTIYFILISGLLFQYLSHKFDIKKYYGSKLKFIILPYVILTLFYYAVRAFVGAETVSFSVYLNGLPYQLTHGMGALWYIPFISIIFLFSPLVLKIPEKSRIKFFPFLLLLPLLGTRTGMDITFGQYLYFAPIYLYGMYISLKLEEVISTVERFKVLIVSLLVIMTIALFFAWYYGLQYEYSKFYLAFVYVRNILASLYILYVLDKGKDKYKYWLDQIAVYSFALYFTHTFIHWKFTSKILESVKFWAGDIGMVIISVLYIPLFVFLNLMVCKLIKKILGKNSRYVIGV